MSETKNVQHCTAKNPMPKDRPADGALWFHHGSHPAPGESKPLKVGESAIYRCPNCSHEFRVTCRPMRPQDVGRALDGLMQAAEKRKAATKESKNA